MSQGYNKTLFTKDSKDKIRFWTISTDLIPDTNGCIKIEIKYGVQGSTKIQTKERFVKSGKNIGKANETTVQQQTLLVIQSLIESQYDRGYVEDINNYKEQILPMLAHKYQDKAKNVVWTEYTYYSSKKLDGIRCFIFINTDGSISFISRTGKPFKQFTHIEGELKNTNLYKSIQIDTTNTDYVYILDGELYSDNLEFPEISSRVNSDDYNSQKDKEIKFFVYDFIDSKDLEQLFEQRLKNIIGKLNGLTHIKVLPQVKTTSLEQMKELFSEYISQGFEGLMLKRNDPYIFAKRSETLLKYKEMLTDEFKILDITLAENDNTKVQILLESKNDNKDPFSIGTVKGNKEDVYDKYYLNKDKLIGKWVTVQYQTLSPYGIPLFPVCIDVREGEEVDNEFKPSV